MRLWVICLHDQSLAVVGCRMGIEANFWASYRKKHKKHKQSIFLLHLISILPPFTHWLLCFSLNMWLKLIVWTSGNNGGQFLLEFDVWLNHTDTLMMSWQLLIHASLLAYLFVHLMIVTFSFRTWLAEIPPTSRYLILFLLPQHERLKNSHLSGRLNLHYSDKADCSNTIKSFVTQLLRQVQPPFATLILSLR